MTPQQSRWAANINVPRAWLAWHGTAAVSSLCIQAGERHSGLGLRAVESDAALFEKHLMELSPVNGLSTQHPSAHGTGLRGQPAVSC